MHRNSDKKYHDDLRVHALNPCKSFFILKPIFFSGEKAELFLGVIACEKK